MKTFLILCSLIFISCLEEKQSNQEPSKVYFTKDISPDAIVKLYKKLGITLQGKVALKVHSGEKDGIYYLRPKFLKKIQDHVKGTFVECNAAYEGQRHNTELHKQLAKEHGWYDEGIRFEIMDEDPEKDQELEINPHKMIDKNYVGEKLASYDSCIVLAHFKGHPMGGFGGVMKQLSIGFASQKGKTYIHSAGNETDWTQMHDHLASQENFTASMADAASSIINNFKKKGGIAYINVMVNISLYCDCGGGDIIPKPKIHDLGIVASLDPVAADQACLDFVKGTHDEGTKEWVDQLNTLIGENTLAVAEELGVGKRQYKLINVDEEDKKNSGNKLVYYGIYAILLVASILL